MKQQETKNRYPSNVENFPTNILLALQTNGIPCACDRKKGVVLVFKDGEYGELFSMYALEGKRIVNNSIYTIPVPKNKRPQVENKLSQLNSTFTDSRFYVDPLTGCIAFYSEHRIGDTVRDEAVSIANFCLHAHTTCIDNQQSLYDLAGSNAYKGASC